ncbi:MAG: DNA-3-methyladenine glycosylase [Clostridiaceae bacterium]
MSKLQRIFYMEDTKIVAKMLLGKLLVHEIDGKRISGIIVETEAYLGVTDKAAHSFGGRKTIRTEPMYGLGGYAYIYFIYGLYNCFNVVTRSEGVPEAVLIRALEPCDGLDAMAEARYNKAYSELNKSQLKNLANGPGKLCMALSIDRNLNGEDLCGNKLYIEDNPNIARPFKILTSKRIGVDYAEEARDFLLRFYIENNK